MAVAYDTPIPGYNTHNCNVLRLWKALPTDVFSSVFFLFLGNQSRSIQSR